MPKPTMYPKPCAHKTCSRVTRTRYCELHTIEHAAEERARLAARPSAAARGYGSEWRRMRDDHLARYPMCNAPGCLHRATLVDHIVPKRFGGADHPGNLQSLCRRCHESKSRREQAMTR